MPDDRHTRCTAEALMKRSHPTPILALAVLGPILFALPACQPDDRQELIQATQQFAIEATDAGPADVEPRRTAPAEIFPDLTRFDWYRRGEPLVVDGRAYQPAGVPEPTGERVFQPAGRYQGVAYYVADEVEPPYTVVYVPVYRDYWQPFALVQPLPAPAQSAETPVDALPDPAAEPTAGGAPRTSDPEPASET